jgi:hypothetical protein
VITVLVFRVGRPPCPLGILLFGVWPFGVRLIRVRLIRVRIAPAAVVVAIPVPVVRVPGLAVGTGVSIGWIEIPLVGVRVSLVEVGALPTRVGIGAAVAGIGPVAVRV